MSLIELMNQHCSTEVAAENWAAVAAKLSGLKKTVHDQKPVSMARTLGALVEKGIDPDTVIPAFETTPMGRGGLAKLATEGLDFGHPLTLGLMQKLAEANAISPQVVAILRELSVKEVPVVGPVTPDACQAAWELNVREKRNQNVLPRFDAILNQLGTGEHAAGIAALRTMADELESI